jgi:hypothetical protein
MIPTKLVRLRLGELLASDPTTLAPSGDEPTDALLWDDGTPLLWDDDTFLLWSD